MAIIHTAGLFAGQPRCVVVIDIADFAIKQIEYIKKLDEKLIVKLQEHQQEVKSEIERTVRSKENVKGYNLNDVK